MEINGYKCIAEFKRANTRSGGVAIFENITSNIKATVHGLKKTSAEYDEQLALADNCGDVCSVQVVLNCIRTLIVVVYISPETTIMQKKYFMIRNLFSYARKNVPILVSGDFNIDVSKQENVDFIGFMKKHLNLHLMSDPLQATTLGGTCIDIVFGKNINVETRRYISYFSYHQPLLSLIEVAD